MKKYIVIIILLISTLGLQAQGNLDKEKTVTYINDKLRVADPVFDSFEFGKNGESLLKWVNNGVYTEYRFNIREVEFDYLLSINQEHQIYLKCKDGTNCLQYTTRELNNRKGDNTSYKNYNELYIRSISGYFNTYSIKNALIYLQVLSAIENQNNQTGKQDPFLFYE